MKVRLYRDGPLRSLPSYAATHSLLDKGNLYHKIIEFKNKTPCTNDVTWLPIIIHDATTRIVHILL